MAVSEESRHRLYTRLEEVLGAEEAETLMEHLPPVGWADVATKRDIDALAVATKRDIEALAAATNHRFDIVESKMATLASRDWIERELRSITLRFTTLLIAAFSALILFATVALAVIKG
jgi:hypothetical protein